MVPFKPQPLAELRQRFIAALKEKHNVSAIIRKEAKAPSGNPENVFDFEIGIRIIVSRDYWQEKEVIHFSGSITDDYKGPTDIRILSIIVSLFIEISGGLAGDIIYIGASDRKNIPNWVIPINNLN